MSAPGRRRNPTITRGKKSERKRNKRRGLQTDNVSPINGLAAISEKAEQERKAKLISNEITDADITLLSEPSNTFNTETNNISNIPTKKEQNLININATNFNSGIELDKTKNDRSRVIKGQKPIIFKTMPKELKKKKNEIKQASRKIDENIIEKTRKRKELEKRNASIEHEKKLLANKKEEEERLVQIEAARLAAIEKKEEERLVQIEAARLAAIEKKEEERLVQIEAARLAAIEKKEEERLVQIEAARLAAIEKKEEERLVQIEVEIKKSVKKKGVGLFAKIFNKLTAVFTKKDKIPTKSQQDEDFKIRFYENSEVLIEEEIELIIDDAEEVQVEEETELIIDDAEEILSEEEIEPITDEIEEEILSEEKVLIEEETELIIDDGEEIQVKEEIEPITDEIEEETELIIDDGEEIQVEEEIEPITDEIEEEILSEEETELIIDDAEIQVEEEIEPIIESGEVILAELRIAMRSEPSPINYTINMLIKKHNISMQNAKYIINHIVSPISICKMLTDDQFNHFIRSLDKDDSEISQGGEIWTQVIQIIGLDSLTKDARVDIYNIFSDVKNLNKISKRVITIALLLNALPNRFEQWWSMEFFPLEVIEHFAQAYKFFRNKKLPQEAIDEARMLLCSYAIEKPKNIIQEYNYAKQMSGNKHENKTEKWLKESLKGVRYITEDQIKIYPDKHYGNKYVNKTITPDILLETPIQLSVDSQPIHWIDAKNHFVDPALSSDENVQSICNQMNKYVRTYGPGLIVWGRNFSEEWNHATKGNVQHIRI